MYRALCLLAAFAVAQTFAFAQTSNTQSNGTAPSPAVQVVDVVDGSTLTTYNVDPETLQAAEVGTITITQSASPELTTAPNGRFLYYIAYQDDSSGKGNEIFVYDTNASGLPGSAPVQELSAPHLYWEAIAHPGGKYLYALQVGVGSNGTTPYEIVRSLIDGNNGTLSHPATEATYQLDSGTSFCNPWILGFNAAGTIMYDAIYCSYPHGSGGATYNERAVDLQTGALGPDQEIFSWSDYAGSEYVNAEFVNNLMFDFAVSEFDGDSVNILRAQPDASTSLVSCSSSMWAVCGNYSSGLAHPSGKYVFLFDSTGVTDIGKVNFSTQQIAQTSSIPYGVGQFSPDGTIVYANGATDIEIYGFSLDSGQATQGGAISLPSGPGTWLAAERF